MDRDAVLGDEVVFLFERDGDVTVARNLDEAARSIEYISARDGEYIGVFRLDGSVVSIQLGDDESVSLVDTRRSDRETLGQLLRKLGYSGAVEGSVDFEAAALDIWHRQWRSSWPRRPRWLGGAPPPLW